MRRLCGRKAGSTDENKAGKESVVHCRVAACAACGLGGSRADWQFSGGIVSVTNKRVERVLAIMDGRSARQQFESGTGRAHSRQPETVCCRLCRLVTAVAAGLLLGWFFRVFSYINPIVQLVRPIAPVAWMPFIVLWFGIGDAPAVAIIFLAGFFPVLLSTVAAVEHMEPVYRKVARNFGLSQAQTLYKVVFPAAFPQIMNSLRLALGTAWIFLVSGEMVGAQSGLGFLIMDAKNCLRSDALLATMITIGIIGLLLDWGIRRMEKFVL